MSDPDPDQTGRAPSRLAEALADLFAVRGLARVQAARELDEAWTRAVGPEAAALTRVEGVRRGVLGVTVSHPVLLQDLAGFRKNALLASLRQDLPGARLRDIRFRIGPIPTIPPPRSPLPPQAPR